MVCGSCHTDRKSLPDPVFDLYMSQPEGLYLLPQGEVTYFLNDPSYALD
jgi:hypothetical protein